MLLHDIITWGFLQNSWAGLRLQASSSAPTVAASHRSLPVTDTDRRTDRRVQRRCLLTHASLRHGISFQLDAPADFPLLIMKPLDVGRFLIMEHSAGQIRFVMTAALFMKGSCVCYWKNNKRRLSIHQPPPQSCGCSRYFYFSIHFWGHRSIISS